ncbi:hypothetical protein AP9108_34400 [Arthrospira sp. PCC 9108]|nr:hypothetical protein AP9108_34400 [Arthrospira sp. PCC 9108]
MKDIVRNRNYRQAVDVIEREVKRLEADDKPRARVRFPRDDGDIDIDVGGMVDFARSMLPKASIEAEDLQDGRTRRGIKTEKIGSTARGFVDLDEDGNPKGFGGTIDSINDANVSVYLGECEQSMSVTIGGKRLLLLEMFVKMIKTRKQRKMKLRQAKMKMILDLLSSISLDLRLDILAS